MVKKRRKATVYLIAVVILLVLSAQSVLAHETIHVPVTLRVNGETVSSDVPSFVSEGRTYVPVRFGTLALNALEVLWNGDLRQATVLLSEERALVLDADSGEMTLNGLPFTSHGQLLVRGDRLFLPVRDLTDLMEAEVHWTRDTYTVDVIKEGIEVPEHLIREPIDPSEWLWLARIVEVEARGTDMEGKLAVANVVLNRMRDDRFPGTVEDVIFQRNVHVQFPPAHRASFRELEPSQVSFDAAKAAFYGYNNIEDALYFNNTRFLPASRFIRQVGGNYFYR